MHVIVMRSPDGATFTIGKADGSPFRSQGAASAAIQRWIDANRAAAHGGWVVFPSEVQTFDAAMADAATC